MGLSMSVTDRLADLTDVALAEDDTNSILKLMMPIGQ